MLPADLIPVGSCVKVMGQWWQFLGETGAGQMVLSDGTRDLCMFVPGDGEVFPWSAPL